MKALAAFIMRGQTHAIAITAGFAILSLVFPLLGLLSAAAVGLVTLRLGPMNGLLVLLAASVLVTGVAMLTATPLIIPTIVSLLVLLVLVWIVAIALRVTRSLALSVTAVAAIGGFFVVVFHLMVGDPAAWWQANFDEFFAQATDSMMMDQQMVFQQNLATWSVIMTGFVTMAFLLNVIFSLFIARSWQAALYNPGGFRDEFHGVQFSKQVAIISLVIATLALLPDSAIASISKDLLMLIMMLYVLQGISIVHAIVGMKGLHWAWLVGLYLLVLLMPQFVAITGYIDTWLDFRKRVAKQN
ncbi:MAG: hypothetical protein AMJ55_02360 [Gammaproteobacteria bacterium SG8_15]|nr:MAG: hypothetical protein AMJ55_02360 [Gammaproteobacteria bacterium SG8_15]